MKWNARTRLFAIAPLWCAAAVWVVWESLNQRRIISPLALVVLVDGPPLFLRKQYLERKARLKAEWAAAGCCLSCGYSLTGNLSGTCPECGKKAG